MYSHHVDPVLIATVCPFRSAKLRIGEFFRTMIPCGSCCIVAATAIRGSPSAIDSRILSDELIPTCAAPTDTCCSTDTYGPPGRMFTSSPASL